MLIRHHPIFSCFLNLCNHSDSFSDLSCYLTGFLVTYPHGGLCGLLQVVIIAAINKICFVFCVIGIIVLWTTNGS